MDEAVNIEACVLPIFALLSAIAGVAGRRLLGVVVPQ